MSLRPFDEIVAEHGQVVLRVCRALVGPDAAQDAWSETFLSALRAYPDLPEGSNVRGWLVTIAHRRTIDVIRARSRAPRPVGDVPDPAVHDGPDHDLGSQDLDSGLADALVALAPKQRAAVAYRYLADLSYAQIADLLDCSEAAARRSAADGIARLRRTIVEVPT